MNLARRFTLSTATVALGVFLAQDARSDEPLVVPIVDATDVESAPVADEPQATAETPPVAEAPAVPDAPAAAEESVVGQAPASAEALADYEPIEIIPADKLPSQSYPLILDSTGVPVSNGVTAADYRRVYDSIPFSRSEYRVNPNYRHDSTMEILTGNSRHQTIVQHNHEHRQPVQRTPTPSRPSRVLVPFSGSSYYWNALPWLWQF